MAHRKLATSARGGPALWDRAEFGLLVVLTYPLFLAALLARRLMQWRHVQRWHRGTAPGVFGQALEETKSTIAIAFTG